MGPLLRSKSNLIQTLLECLMVQLIMEEESQESIQYCPNPPSPSRATLQHLFSKCPRFPFPSFVFVLQCNLQYLDTEDLGSDRPRTPCSSTVALTGHGGEQKMTCFKSTKARKRRFLPFHLAAAGEGDKVVPSWTLQASAFRKFCIVVVSHTRL